MFTHAERETRRQQVDGQRQSPGCPAEARQHGTGQTGRQPGAGHGGRKDKGAEDEKHRLIAKERIGLFGRQDSGQRQHHHGEERSYGDRQQP